MFSFRILCRDNSNHIQQDDQRENELVSKNIKSDLKSVDLKISLYMAACGALPLSEIHPCPPVISNDANRIVDAQLLSVHDRIPPPECLLQLLKRQDELGLSSRTFRVIKWLTVDLREPRISYVQPEQYQDILKLAGAQDSFNDGLVEPVPEAIFSVKDHAMSVMRQEWLTRTYYEQTSFGFLPCKVEDLHSMLYKGKISSSSRARGPVELFTNLKYCVSIAPSSWTWGKSKIGTNLKVVALVEFVESHANTIKEEIEVEHPEMGSVVLRNYRLTEIAAGRIRSLLVYPQEKRHMPFTAKDVRTKPNYVKGTIVVAWAIIICVTCILPTLKSVETIP